MPSTYTLISSNVLSSSAASVTFSAIPSTYTDLVLKYSARLDYSAAVRDLQILINGATTNYSYTSIRGSGSAASSNSNNARSYLTYEFGLDADTATANTFASGDIYIPSYTVSQNKPMSGFTSQENNTTAAYTVATAALWVNTSAITSVQFNTGGGNFVSGSSFYLYGIKNS